MTDFNGLPQACRYNCKIVADGSYELNGFCILISLGILFWIMWAMYRSGWFNNR